MNFNQLLSAQIVIFAFIFFALTHEVKSIPLPAPLPGGVSQVGFTIYRNKEEYDEAQAQKQQSPYTAQNQEKVFVTYAVSHPSDARTGNQGNAGADISKNYYDYTQHFTNHQQHQKQIEAFRQEQQRGGVNSAYYSSPNQQSVNLPVPVPVRTAIYKQGNVTPVPSKPAEQRQQQIPKVKVENYDKNMADEQPVAPIPATQQMYFSSNYLQKPAPVDNVLSIQPDDLLHQQRLVALAKITKSKAGKLSETLDLNDALDTKYPVTFY